LWKQTREAQRQRAASIKAFVCKLSIVSGFTKLSQTLAGTALISQQSGSLYTTKPVCFFLSFGRGSWQCCEETSGKNRLDRLIANKAIH